jgi:putative addiction module killer protein
VVHIIETEQFVKWAEGLKDPIAEVRIQTRIRRLSVGNPGDVRPVGAGVSELRIDWGPGYRVYFVTRGSRIVVILGGGTKQTQARDIREAHALARQLTGEAK